MKLQLKYIKISWSLVCDYFDKSVTYDWEVYSNCRVGFSVCYIKWTVLIELFKAPISIFNDVSIRVLCWSSKYNVNSINLFLEVINLYIFVSVPCYYDHANFWLVSFWRIKLSIIMKEYSFVFKSILSVITTVFLFLLINIAFH